MITKRDEKISPVQGVRWLYKTHCYNPEVEIFIAWGGQKSLKVAEALRDWLPKILNAFQPWLSTEIDAGARWFAEIVKRLQSAGAGIVCLTPGNLSNEWILFETGALSMAVPESFACQV